MNNKNDENYVYYLVAQNLESEKYHQTFSLGTLWKFAEVLNIDIRELFKPLDEKR